MFQLFANYYTVFKIKTILVTAVVSLFFIPGFSQVEQLEVDGAIQLGNSQDPTPDAGTLRWNSAMSDFEGFDGVDWLSLTANSSPETFPYGIPHVNIVHEKHKLIASDRALDDYFGQSVSASGEYIIVGAPGDDDNGDLSGSAYIFFKSDTNWIEQAKLTASDGAADDIFGYVVSFHGDYAIIGAFHDDDHGSESGSAYIFHRVDTTWTQQAKLTASDATAMDHFGICVSISGDYAIVGAPNNSSIATGSGAAYIFHRNDTIWTEQTKLTASDAAFAYYFGSSADIDTDYVMVGSPGNNDAAYIFHRMDTNWIEQTKLNTPDTLGVSFAYDVAITENDAIVGTFNSDVAHIYHRSDTSWSLQDILIATDGDNNDAFGRSIKLSGDYAIVGADSDDDFIVNQGSAYIFHRNNTTWSQQVKLIASDGAMNDSFGFRVHVESGYAVVSAYGDDNNRGAVYIY